jgi:hypothetical protein
MECSYFETQGNVYQSPRNKTLEDVTLLQHSIELNLALFFKTLPPLFPVLCEWYLKLPGTEFEAVQRLVSNLETVTSNEMGGWLQK